MIATVMSAFWKVAVLGVFGLITLPIVQILRTRRNAQPRREEMMRLADHYLLLAHFLEPNGDMSQEYMERSRRVADLWHTYRKEVHLWGGKTKGQEISQAWAAKIYLISLGVAAEDIMTIDDLKPEENLGHSTCEEVNIDLFHSRLSGRVLPPIVISNLLHLAQADIEFRRGGVKPILVPSRQRCWSTWYLFQRLSAVYLSTFNIAEKMSPWLRRGRTQKWGSTI